MKPKTSSSELKTSTPEDIESLKDYIEATIQKIWEAPEYTKLYNKVSQNELAGRLIAARPDRLSIYTECENKLELTPRDYGLLLLKCLEAVDFASGAYDDPYQQVRAYGDAKAEVAEAVLEANKKLLKVDTIFGQYPLRVDFRPTLFDSIPLGPRPGKGRPEKGKHLLKKELFAILHPTENPLQYFPTKAKCIRFVGRILRAFAGMSGKETAESVLRKHCG